MVNARLFFDTRRLDKEGRGQFRIVVTKKGRASMISLGIKVSPEEWDGKQIINRKDSLLLNRLLLVKRATVTDSIMKAISTDAFVGKSAIEIAEYLKERLNPELAALREEERNKEQRIKNSFLKSFSTHIERYQNAGTRQLYLDTYHKVEGFCKYMGIEPEELSIHSINKSWLQAFNDYCLITESQNTASRHLRDIRAVFNNAIDEGVTSNYPFRKFTIKKAETVDKSFSANDLRRLFAHKCFSNAEQEAVDMLKLMFCLIGINSIDLVNANTPRNGRLNYIRAKTHKPYSIKIEPEALHLINTYKGEGGKLVHILDKCPNYKTYFNRMGKTLRKVGLTRQNGKKNTGRAILPDICVGSARTSWATIAQEELDIPREVIAAALGHHTVDVTSTYLRTDWKNKVDKANRKVLDWVLYGKKKK